MKRKSFILKVFMILAILITLLSIMTGSIIYNVSRKTITQEIMSLNQSSLRQVSDKLSNTIEEAKVLAETIGSNNRILSTLCEDLGENPAEDSINYSEGILADYVWSNPSHKTLYDAYVIGYNGLSYAAYPSSRYSMKQVMDLPIYQKVMENNGELTLIETTNDENEIGIYRYVFQIGKELKDLISKKPCGFLMIRISENVLFSDYKDLIRRDKKFLIVDEQGIVLSAKNKNEIDKKYEYELSDMQITDNTYQLVERDNKEYCILTNRIQGTNWYLAEELSIASMLSPLNRITGYIVGTTSIFIFIIWILQFYFAKKILNPFFILQTKLEKVTCGDLDVSIEVNREDEIGDILMAFNKMVEQLKVQLEMIENKEKQKRLAELDFLRAQINPHFIYNTLSSVRFYIEMGKSEEADEMLLTFSKLLRKTLSRSDEFITIEEEMEILKNYVKLQMIRYPSAFCVDYKVEDSIGNQKIPAFVLQPIVENAIFHGMKKNKICEIKITAEIENKRIKIGIEDNGNGMNDEQVEQALNKENHVNGIGIINVNERIKLNYGNDYGLFIKSEEGIGTKVTLWIPKGEETIC